MTTHIDVIILSYAKTPDLKLMTQNCIDSLMESENPKEITFNVIVLESQKNLQPFQFDNAKTIYPKEAFNFHRYLNIGKNLSEGKYICFCNNDLLFHKRWASELISVLNKDEGIYSVSPICPQFHPTLGINEDSGNYEGYGVRKEISGWCFMVDRSIFDIIGPFDEHFKFWFADADYSKVLQKHKLRQILVTSSKVTHLDGRSTLELNAREAKAMTTGQYWYFQYKWEHKNWLIYIYRKLRSNLKNFNLLHAKQ